MGDQLYDFTLFTAVYLFAAAHFRAISLNFIKSTSITTFWSVKFMFVSLSNISRLPVEFWECLVVFILKIV